MQLELQNQRPQKFENTYLLYLWPLAFDLVFN